MLKTLNLNPFAIIIPIWAMNFVLSTFSLILNSNWEIMTTSFVILSFYMYKWMNNFFNESLMGFYLKFFKNIMKISFLLFILSEIMLFSTMFWMFFHSSISPTMEIGSTWPPQSMSASIYPTSLPLAGSVTLLLSGFSITLSHHFIIKNDLMNSMRMINMTMKFGKSFVAIQLTEFFSCFYKIFFCMNDSVYSNSFFFITGLHGSHVLGGFFYMKHTFNKIISTSNFNLSNFEMMSWYWHFVDVVWIFVFSLIYWWNFLFKNNFQLFINKAFIQKLNMIFKKNNYYIN